MSDAADVQSLSQLVRLNKTRALTLKDGQHCSDGEHMRAFAAFADLKSLQYSPLPGCMSLLDGTG